MKHCFGKVWPTLGMVMAVSGGVAITPSAVALADTPPTPRVAARVAGVAVFPPEIPPRLSASKARPLAPVGKAKSYALVLSSFSVIGVIAFHRLTRMF